MKLFTELPEDLKGLSPEDLAAAVADHSATLLKIKDRDPETLGDLTMSEVLEQAKAGKAAYDALQAEVTARAETDSQFDELIAEVTDGVTPAEEAVATAEADAAEAVEVLADAEAATADAPAEGEGEAAAAEAPAEPVLASGQQKAARPRPPAPPKNQAVAVMDEGPQPVALVASTTTNSDSKVGDVLDQEKLTAAMAYAYQNLTASAGQKVFVARANWKSQYPEERQIKEGMGAAAIQNLLAPMQSLVASGGLCAPVTPYYQLQTVAVADRPVRDSMAPYAAVRGGLQFGRPLGLADVAGGVGYKTEAQDAAGGTNAAKDCLFVECPDFETSYLNMVYQCFQFGNLNSRSYPEMVSQVLELGAAYHARLAETLLLDYVAASSTATTQAQIYGAVASMIDAILYAAAGMRSRNRMNPAARLRVLLPSWVRELLAADTVNSQFYRGQVTPGDAEGLLRSYGVEPSFYLDTPTGAGQIFGAQTAGALLDFPNTVVWFIYPEGSFLFLDGGTLDLGVVRDSTLNATNDFEYFIETFEAAAYVGVESLKVTSTVCQSGATGGPATLITC